ncbi:MAG: MqnA/MqnD/SBP family protein [Nitrososphaeraceae archaeon]
MKCITLGHTPDADDAFMFYAIAAGKVTSAFFNVEHVIDDIETLNKRAINHELDVTAISAHAYAYTQDYTILRSGGSFGLGYGPIVIGKKPMDGEGLRHGTIAIPGQMTSANLMLKLAIGNFDSKEMIFSSIPDAVLSGSVDAGLIIHEAQISLRDKFYTVMDLGKWWNIVSQGMPVPLGINVASRRSMTVDEINKFDSFFRNSIEYGLKNMDEAINYAMKYARGSANELIKRFVKMYVNQLTINMGSEGEGSITLLLNKARDEKLLTFGEIEFAKDEK